MSISMARTTRGAAIALTATLLGSSLLSEATPQAADATHALTLLKPDQADFKAVPGAAKCNKMASLRGDLAKGPSTFTTLMTAGCIAPWHWHTPTEEIVILKGEAVMQMKGEVPITLPTGAYSQLPPKHLHRFRCTKGSDCVVLVIADAAFDIHWVNSTGAEIPVDEAIKVAEQEGTKGW
jgi:quercetin dioxygenase-like cupin family protein